ncbi:uncharacterized protein LOC142162177 [Nicotiana tabacum]|uniref:Uncharacterized protein LOC142162177 n=1 Tax=Nicotiana tabacum TaxID=4097 RepID=A0AC58RPF3_TOBAC
MGTIDDQVNLDTGNQNRTATGNHVSGIDYNHPLFLSPADVSEIQIISFQLTGIENYSIWNRSMCVALLGRNKLGMVDGTCRKEKFPDSMENHWERVNAIVLSWLMNSVAKGLLGGIMYASSAQTVWEDLSERFNKIDGSRTFNLHKEIAALSQCSASVSVYFSKLKDLWEEFEALIPSPGCDCPKSREFVSYLQKLRLYQFFMGLNESYSQARSQILMKTPLPTVNQAYALVVSDESQRSISANSGILGANPVGNLGIAMYTRAGGGGQNHRLKRNFNISNGCSNDKSANERQYDQLANYSQGMEAITNQLGNFAFTKEQYDQIVQLLKGTSTTTTNMDSAANATGTDKAFLVSNGSQEWIIDTGATNHMDLFTEKVREIGKEVRGLYILLAQLARNKNRAMCAARELTASEANKFNVELWHQRFGHVSIIVLKRMQRHSREMFYLYLC